jgi:hypothetical protein
MVELLAGLEAVGREPEEEEGAGGGTVSPAKAGAETRSAERNVAPRSDRVRPRATDRDPCFAITKPP